MRHISELTGKELVDEWYRYFSNQEVAMAAVVILANRMVKEDSTAAQRSEIYSAKDIYIDRHQDRLLYGEKDNRDAGLYCHYFNVADTAFSLHSFLRPLQVGQPQPNRYRSFAVAHIMHNERIKYLSLPVIIRVLAQMTRNHGATWNKRARVFDIPKYRCDGIAHARYQIAMVNRPDRGRMNRITEGLRALR